MGHKTSPQQLTWLTLSMLRMAYLVLLPLKHTIVHSKNEKHLNQTMSIWLHKSDTIPPAQTI